MKVYCDALTIDVNCLTDKQYDEDYNAAKIVELEKTIAPRFLFMGRALCNYPQITRECILTAYSLAPSKELYDAVVNMARKIYTHWEIADDGSTSGYLENQNDRIETFHVLGDKIPQTEYNENEVPSSIFDSILVLSETVRIAITTLLHTIRLKTLSWADPWPILNQRCRELLNPKRKLSIADKTTAGYNSRLKYLNLNPADYAHLKPREYPGYEPGYEHYAQIEKEDSSVEILAGDGDLPDQTDSTSSDDPSYQPDSARNGRKRKRMVISKERKINEQSGLAVTNRNNKTANLASTDGKALKPRRPKAKPKIDDKLAITEPSNLLPNNGSSRKNTRQLVPPVSQKKSDKERESKSAAPKRKQIQIPILLSRKCVR